jgi:DNA-directed RNA polymerase subunit L
MGHIVLDYPKFYVRTKKGTPKNAIKKAVETIIADIKTISDGIA